MSDGRLEVLHVVEATLGGLRRHVADLLLELARHHHGDVGLHLAYSLGRADGGFRHVLPALEAGGVRCFECDMRRAIHPPSDLAALSRLWRYARANRIRIVHGHSAKGGYLGRLAAAFLPGTRSLYTPNASPFRLSPAYLALEILAGRALTTRIIAVSESERRELLAHRIAPASRVVTIPSGIPERSAARQPRPAGWPFRRDEPVVASAGRITAQKAPLRFVAIAAAVARRRSEARFLWIGDGELRPEMERAIRDAGLGDRVAISGWVEDVVPWLAHSSVFVLASEYESFGYVTVEAMREGLPCVVSDVPGSCDVVVDETTGYVVPRTLVDAYAGAVDRLLADAALRERLGEAGRHRWRSEFLASRMAERTYALYRSLVGR